MHQQNCIGQGCIYEPTKLHFEASNCIFSFLRSWLPGQGCSYEPTILHFEVSDSFFLFFKGLFFGALLEEMFLSFLH